MKENRKLLTVEGRKRGSPIEGEFPAMQVAHNRNGGKGDLLARDIEARAKRNLPMRSKVKIARGTDSLHGNNCIRILKCSFRNIEIV